MAQGRQNQRRPEDDRAAVQQLFASLASEDPDTVLGVLRANPALAEAVLGPLELQHLLQSLAADGALCAPGTEVQARTEFVVTPVSAATDEERPGVFTELTRELSPERAEQLYRKVVPLVVYELLRVLDQNAQLGTVQHVVDHLCSPDVQARLRQCPHVRDGLLDELARVLRDRGVRAAIDRAGVQTILEQCGVTGELVTLANCLRFTQAAG